VGRQFRNRTSIPPLKPASSWARIASTAFGVIPANTKVLFGSFVLTTANIGVTVKRTRGNFSYTTDNVGALEQSLGAWGMIAVSDIALGVGVASIPGPVTDLDDDGWFVWEPMCLQNILASSGLPRAAVDFDSKAMRKIAPGFGIAIVIENAHATHGMNVALNISLLTAGARS